MTIQIPNLGTGNGSTGDNELKIRQDYNNNFSNSSHAASKTVGAGAGEISLNSNLLSAALATRPTQAASLNTDITGIMFANGQEATSGAPEEQPYTNVLSINGFGYSQVQIALPYNDPSHNFYIRSRINSKDWSDPVSKPWAKIYHSQNTTVDSNGFIKGSSPVVDLYSDRAVLSHDAEKQGVTFLKVGTGDYVVKDSLGFAQEGWYIETPKDANGNVLVAVVYKQLANNDLSIKTYAKKFDDETGDIVANLTKPRDIPTGRFISLRLHELPKEPPMMPTEPQPEV